LPDGEIAPHGLMDRGFADRALRGAEQVGQDAEAVSSAALAGSLATTRSAQVANRMKTMFGRRCHGRVVVVAAGVVVAMNDSSSAVGIRCILVVLRI